MLHQADWVTAFASVVLVVVTSAYAVISFLSLKASNKAVREMARQTEALTRPYVTISTFVPPDLKIIFLKIENTGKTSAEHVRLVLDRNFFPHGEKDSSRITPLHECSAFRQTIACLAPGMQLIFALGGSWELFKDRADHAITPLVFSVEAQYGWSDKKVIESTTVDLRPWLGSHNEPHPMLNRMEKLQSAVEGVKDSAREIAKAIERKNGER